MNSHVIRINAGERVDVKTSGGCSTTITGPAFVVLVKEESAATTTDLNDYDFINGKAVKRTE